jgi:hypothetical protein
MGTENLKKPHKCFYDRESNFNPCPGLDRVLEYDKGIHSPLIFNFNTGEQRNAYVAYKKNRKDKGIAFNVCPFCSQPILNDKKQLNTDKIPYYDEQDGN